MEPWAPGETGARGHRFVTRSQVRTCESRTRKVRSPTAGAAREPGGLVSKARSPHAPVGGRAPQVSCPHSRPLLPGGTLSRLSLLSRPRGGLSVRGEPARPFGKAACRALALDHSSASARILAWGRPRAEEHHSEHRGVGIQNAPRQGESPTVCGKSPRRATTAPCRRGSRGLASDSPRYHTVSRRRGWPLQRS